MRDVREEPAPRKAHSLTLDGRERAVLTGVEEVDSFNEQMIVVNTCAGAMTLMGEQLNVSSLDLTEGRLVIQGRVDALEYDEKKKQGRGGLKKLFR